MPTNFYTVPETGYDPIDCFKCHDKTALLDFLADEGTAEMRVLEHGEDVTVRIALELADRCGRSGEFECGFDSTFPEFAQTFAARRCAEHWAEIERQYYEDIQYGTRFRGDWGYAL